MNVDKALNKIKKKRIKVQLAKEDLLSTIRKSFPIGSTVWWYHGYQRFHAKVEIVRETGVFVFGNSGKSYPICSSRIVHISK